MAASELPAWATGITALVATAGTAAWLQLKERKTRKDVPTAASPEAQVVAATFTERSLMERLIAALLAMNETLAGHHDEVKRLNGHLEQERHDREIAKAVREAVERERGKL